MRRMYQNMLDNNWAADSVKSKEESVNKMPFSMGTGRGNPSEMVAEMSGLEGVLPKGSSLNNTDFGNTVMSTPQQSELMRYYMDGASNGPMNDPDNEVERIMDKHSYKNRAVRFIADKLRGLID